MSVNLVTLGMFYSLAVFGWVPDGSPVAAIVLSGIAVTFLAITYAGLIAVMPRAGGDYVWQTRVLDGPPGAVVGAVVGGLGVYLAGTAGGFDTTITLIGAVVGVVVGGLLGLRRGGVGFMLALWAPIYGAILNLEFAQPLAALIGQADIVNWLGTSDGGFAVSMVVV